MQDELAQSSPSRKLSCNSFTLVEMLVTMAILIIVLGIILQLTTQIASVWKSSNARVQTFQEARTGFEAMTRRLSQATLNTYYNYYYINASGVGTLITPQNVGTYTANDYDRVSELHFISGKATTLLAASPTAITTQTQAVFFQAPVGYSVTYPEVDSSLNACGYFLQFDAGTNSIPSYIVNSPTYKPRYRYRLMEMLQPTENLGVYADTTTGLWFVNNAESNCRILAENVVALVLLPKLPPSDDSSGTALAPAYNYNSRIPLGAASDPIWTGFPQDTFTAQTNSGTAVPLSRHHQLPPLMHVVMIVIDEPSAIRLQGSSTTVPSAINFSTLFTSATSLSSDLQTAVNQLNATQPHLNYRIFTSDVIMRDAKWSNQ